MTSNTTRILTLSALASAIWLGACNTSLNAQPESNTLITVEGPMQIQYLEIVTENVEETCAALEALHGVTFGEPQDGLGFARVAEMKDGGRIGVRAPLAEHDTPIVRPYMLVDDIEAAIETAEAAGAMFAMKATEVAGHGTFAIYFLGGIQYGLWEL
ncbi:MAG: hydroxylase [Pseudomonadota bacterium]